MKNKLISILSMAFALIFFTTLASSDASAQKARGSQEPNAKAIELTSSTGTTARGGTDPHIKHGEMANDPNSKGGDAPRAKGGNTRGGDMCKVVLDNSTSWYIKIYVDGTYRGTMDPWGDSSTYTLAGDTSVYAKAEFTDGTYRYWGPKGYDCGPGQYINFRMVK